MQGKMIVEAWDDTGPTMLETVTVKFINKLQY